MFRSLIATIMLSFASTQGASIKKDAPLYNKVNETTHTKNNLQLDNPDYRSYFPLDKIQTINSGWSYDYNSKNSWQIIWKYDDQLQQNVINRRNNYYTERIKYHKSTKNEAWTIDTSLYVQNRIIETIYESTGLQKGGLYKQWNYSNGDRLNNCEIYIQKLTPHNKASTTNLNADIVITQNIEILDADLPTNLNMPQDDTYIFEIDMMYYIYAISTTDPRVEQYVNMSLSNEINPYQIFDNIKDNFNDISYDYYEDYEEREIARVTYDVREDITTIQNNYQDTVDTIPSGIQYTGITTDTTNYIITFVTRYMTAFEIDYSTFLPETNFIIKDKEGTYNAGRYYYEWFHSPVIDLNGTYRQGTTQEIVDIPGLCFTILGMPFQFYSTAFNITWFAGTPYAINISNLILTILACLIFIFIIRLILKVFT